MIWAVHLAGDRAIPVLRETAERCYAKQPHAGMTNEKLGNAAVVSLALIENGAGIPVLSQLRSRSAQPKIRKLIGRELERAAKGAGINRHELEELNVPDHGLAAGPLRLPVGQGAAVIGCEHGKIRLGWERADGTISTSVPADLKNSEPDSVKDARTLFKEIETDLATQSARIEQLYLGTRSWDYLTWRTRYADHGTLALLTRALLWCFEIGGETLVALPGADGITTLGDTEAVPETATVRLWHPLDSPADEISAWRAWLSEREIVQPFRQAWRETYTLTDAERETGDYSNRFAAHMLYQHQMMAIAHRNDWQCTHRVAYDVPSDEPNHIKIPDQGLQAEFWTAPAGRDGPVSDGGAYLYIVTDRVKFHKLDDKAKFGRGAEVGLDSVPDRVFSEIMRHCDLFVSVASIGIDPEWQDKGGGAAHPSNWQRDADQYWNWSQSAPLTGSGLMRKEMLALILAGLKNADLFEIEDRHLRVTGRRHDYLIHLGSGGIQIADTRKHVCIVPEQVRRKAVALPFETDTTLSMIVSKALMLANDDKISDPVILQQL